MSANSFSLPGLSNVHEYVFGVGQYWLCCYVVRFNSSSYLIIAVAVEQPLLAKNNSSDAFIMDEYAGFGRWHLTL